MSYSRSFKSSYRFSTDDDPSYSASSSSRYSSGLGRESSSLTGSLSNRNSLLNDYDSNLGASSGRKKLRSDYDSSSFDYGAPTQSGSGYGSSRRFESASALTSSYTTRETGSSIRKNYLDDDDDDYLDKYSPRQLTMLQSSSRNQQLTARSEASSMHKKSYLDDDDDNDLSISSSIYKRTRYNKLDDQDDKEDNFSIRSSSIRKYSSSSNASYLKDDPDQFYAELTSRTSKRYSSNNNKNLDDDFKDEDDFKTSRFLSKQSTRDDQKYQLDDDYLSTTSSHSRRQMSRLSSKDEIGSGSSKPQSRFLSKYASREQIQDEDDDTSKFFTRNSRFNSREELNKDDDLATSRDILSKYKKYSREESNASVLSEKPLIPENRLDRNESIKSERSERVEKAEVNTFSSLSFKTSRMFKDSSQDDQQSVKQQEVTTTSSSNKSSFLDKENQSKSYLEDENSILDDKESSYYVIIDYSPPKSSPEEIELIEGQRVTVLSKDKPNKWRVQTHNYKNAVGMIGYAPSCYLEPLEEAALPGFSSESLGKDSLGKSASVQQAQKKRKNIIKELVETEEDFNRDISFISNTYLKHMESSLMPKELKENKCKLFDYFRQIANFHNNELSKAIQFYNQEEPNHIESVFLRMEREFDTHVAYCRDLPQVQQMLKEGPFKEYFDSYSLKIKDDKRLSDHLKLPVQRINDYQLLIKELIKYTARLNENTKDLEKALEFVSSIPQRGSDLQLIQSIQGYRGNLHDTGRLLKQDWFKVIGPDNRPYDRYCILFKQKLLITDQQNAERGRKVYFIKNLFKLNEINATNGDDDLSIVLTKKNNEPSSALPIILKAETNEQRTNWLNEFYNCRQLTREELSELDEPEFTIVEEENNKDALCRKSSLERTPKLQKADSKLSNSDNKSFEKANDEQEKVQKKEEMTLERIEKQDLQTSSNPSRQNSKQSSRQNSIKKEEQPDELSAKDESKYKKQTSRDLQDLPKPQKNEPQKMNSLSRQSTSQELSRKLSASSSGVATGERTPTEISRQNSRNSINDKSNQDKIIDSLVDKSERQPSLSRKSSSKENVATEKQKLSREGSRRSSVKRQESRVQEDFQVYEESTSVPMSNENNGGLQRNSSKSSSRKASIDKPKFKKELKDITVNTNETVLLECELEPCKDQLTLEWLKDNKVLNIAGRYVSSNQDNIYTLQINKAIARDTGIFALTATSPYAQTISSCKVTVKPLERQSSRVQTPDSTLTAPVFKVKLKDTELKESSTVRFELHVTGPPTEWKFFKNDKPLKEDDRIKIEYTTDEACEIVIENCQKSDAGHYKCTASNSEGSDTTECNVTVSSDKDVFKGLPAEENQDVSEISVSPTSDKHLSTSRMNSNPNSRPRTPAFKWFRDGEEFDANERFHCQFDESEDTIGLIFQHVTPEDAGLYTCVASTQGGKISCSAELTVQGEVNRLLRDPEPPKFLEKLNDTNVNQGSTATIEVKVTGYPKPTIIFEHNNQEIQFPSDKHKLLYEDDDNITLIIKNAQPDDAGEYKVTAKNDLDSVQDSCKLTVQSPPKFIQQLENKDVLKGKPLELSVKVQGSPKPTCTFFKDGKPLDEKTAKKMKFECKEDGDTYTFIAKCDSADLEDAGNYSVTVASDCGQQNSACTVNVNAPPEILGLKDIGGQENDTVHFRVQVKGSPKPAVQFLRNDKPIDLNKETNIKLEEEEGGYHRLTISKLNKDQCGKISVVAKNDFGEKKADARLDIKSKPEFTQKLSDLVGKEGETAELAVKVDGFPTPDLEFKLNGKPIDLNNKDKYELQKKDDGTVVLKIKDLKPEDAGKISVIAKNSEGEIESSCALQVNSPPKFTTPLKNAVLNENEKISLKVKCTGFPKPELTWFHNNKKLVIDDKRIKVVEKTDKNGETECELIITGSVSTDTGTYKCKAKNITGEVSTDCSVLVSSMPIFTQGMTDVDAVDKQPNVEFNVKLKKQPTEPNVKWYIDDKPITDDDPRFTLVKPDKKAQKQGSEDDGDEYKLIIKEASPELSGMVKCEARNQFGVSECYASFTVKKKPHFIQELNSIQYAELNKPVKLQVKAAGWPKPNCKWNCIEESTAATITISEDSVLKDGEEIVTSTVEIEKLTVELCGNFECVAVNEMGEVVTKGRIEIGSKPELLKDLGDLNVKEGDHVEFEVKISTTNPEPEISWFKDGKLIGKNDDFSIEKQKDDVYKLVCTKASLDHQAEYHFVAKNPLGECQSKKAKLTVSKSEGAADLGLKDKTKKSPSEDDDNKKKRSSGDDLLNKDKDKDKDKKKALFGKSMDSFDIDNTKTPKIRGLTDVGVNLGESATLVAIISGKEPEVTWFKSGISLGTTDNITIASGDDVLNHVNKDEKEYLLKNKNNGVLHSLTIKNVQEANLDAYTLKAHNKYGQDEKTANVTQKSSTPVFLVDLPNSVKVKEGSTLRLEAKVDGNPMPCVKWFKNGQEIFTNNLNDQLNRLTDPLSNAIDDDAAKNKEPVRKDSKVGSKPGSQAGSRKGSLKGTKSIDRKDSVTSGTATGSGSRRGSRKDSAASASTGTADKDGDKKLKRLPSKTKSVDKDSADKNNRKSSMDINQFESGKTLGSTDQPNYCVSSNDIYNNDRIKIDNYANGVCVLTIDKVEDDDDAVYSVSAINKNGQVTSNCKVDVVSKYWRSYSPPASVKHKMETDPNYKPPMEYGLRGRKANEHFDFKSDTNYQIGPDTYVLQYRDTSFPLRIREYLRIGSSRSPSLANQLKEQHWGFSHPETHYYPSVSIRERRRFIDVMDEEIKDEKTGETNRSQPMRLIREIPTSNRGYGQVTTLRSEVARNDSKEDLEEDLSKLQPISIGSDQVIIDEEKSDGKEDDKKNKQETEAEKLIKRRKLKQILKSDIPFFREKIKDTTASEEQNVKFRCFAVGKSQLSYTWFKDDRLLIDDTKITIHNLDNGRSELEIKDLNEYDFGRYKCLARNDHGAVVCHALLKRPNTINSIPNEDVQTELDYLTEIDKERKNAQFKEEELYSFNGIFARGRYSLILKATEKSTNKQLACKAVLDKDVDESGMKNELKILSTLCHERIVQFESAAHFKNMTLIAMEPLSGIDVLTYLSLQSTYTEALITKIISQVTDAIEYLHFRGIALLELQPDNVVMTNAAQPFIKLVDFSNARYVPSKGEDNVEINGNPAYLAPELLLKQRVTYAADIWCIGVLTYILLSGQNPFAGETEKETQDNVCFVRFNFNQIFKQTSQEAIRFLIFIFKKDAEKRPTIEEVQNNKWLFCDDYLVRKRESITFAGALLNAFSLEFHSNKEKSGSLDELAKVCGV